MTTSDTAAPADDEALPCDETPELVVSCLPRDGLLDHHEMGEQLLDHHEGGGGQLAVPLVAGWAATSRSMPAAFAGFEGVARRA